jgi:hypothetical protein
MTIFFTTTNDKIKMQGKTFYVKNFLKEMGAKWVPAETAWTLPIEKDSPDFRANLLLLAKDGANAEKEARKVEKAKEIERQRYLYSPEFVKDALKAKAEGDHSLHWICCDQCKILDWARQHTSCQACGHDNGFWKDTFFVGGRLRTGD